MLAARDALVVSPQVLGELHNAVLRGKVAAKPEDARRMTLELQPSSQGATDLELVALAWAIRGETAFQ